jgi:hypothetical protein
MKICSWPGCDREVLARDLCSRHYQRQFRKKGPPTSSKPGPAPKYPDVVKNYAGAPVVTIRLEPEVWRWVMEHGGARWVRELLRGCHRLRGDSEVEACIQRLMDVEP